ncbi:MAG: hypothetical protein AAGA68_05470 [Pseudomonadota bacterium]
MNEPRHLIGCVLSLILLYSLQQHATAVDTPDPESGSPPAALAQDAPASGVRDSAALDDPLQANLALDVIE